MNPSHLLLAIPVFFFAFATIEWISQTRSSQSRYNRRQQGGGIRQSIEETVRIVAKNGLNRALLRTRGYRQRLDQLLVRSGYPFEWKAEDLLFYKQLTIVAVVVLLWQLGVLETKDPLTDPPMWILAAIVSFMIPDFLLRVRASARKAQMQRQLPSFVDLMALAVDGGLDFTVAVERITEKMRANALRQELHVLLQESRLGTGRKEILQRWANRTDLSDAQSLSSLIIQSEEMGTPLANVLRSYAEDMRSRRILRAEEIAGKIPVKILFPMMVFFFPIVFVIILGPIALQFVEGAK
jgi:tight adherence protein C